MGNEMEKTNALLLSNNDIDDDDAEGDSGKKDDPDLERLERRLATLRQQRREVRQWQETLATAHETVQQVLAGSEWEQEQALLDYRSVWFYNKKCHNLLKLSQKWYVLSDCFHISHRGPFGTINGLRLGAEAPSCLDAQHMSSPSLDQDNNSEHSNSNPPTSSSSYFYPRRHPFALLSFTTSSTNNTDATHTATTMSSNTSITSNTSHHHGSSSSAISMSSNNNNNNNTTTITATTIRVPWMEINAALGHVALLLATMEARPHAGIVLRHVLVPTGSFSKIGIRTGCGTSSSSSTLSALTGGLGGSTNSTNNNMSTLSLYPLYYCDDHSFQFFAKRNFNTALQCLVECVVDAAHSIQQRDRTITLPHALEKLSVREGGSWTVGKLPIAYTGTEGTAAVEWTRAMKYLLTDIKHLLTHKALNLWE